MLKVLLTGATGFLGSRVAGKLLNDGRYALTCAVRRPCDQYANDVVVGELDSNTDWSIALREQQVLIHTAARAHIMKDDISDPLAEYRRVNVEGTLNLAGQAAKAGVRRFVFISSIKVNGERTGLNQPFTAEDGAAPKDPYGISKMEAEEGLQKLASMTDMDIVIIRPPLVYGPGVKGNFASIIRLVETGLPLPLGAIHNKRSLVAVDNLIDLIVKCIDHPGASNQIFLAGDGEDISTTELFRGIARVMGKPSRLIPIPAGLLMFCGTLLGNKAMAQRLLDSLQVDISKARKLLGWQPPLNVEQGLKRCFSDH